MADLRVEVALAILNSDRGLAGFPPVARLDSVPGSEGYLTNADAVIAVFVDVLRTPLGEGARNRSMYSADDFDKVVQLEEWRAGSLRSGRNHQED